MGEKSLMRVPNDRLESPNDWVEKHFELNGADIDITRLSPLWLRIGYAKDEDKNPAYYSIVQVSLITEDELWFLTNSEMAHYLLLKELLPLIRDAALIKLLEQMNNANDDDDTLANLPRNINSIATSLVNINNSMPE